MAISPKRVALEIALRTQQLSGVNQAALELAYQTGYTSLDGADVPVSGLVDAVIAVEAELHEVIANDKAHPYRNFIYGRSEDLVTATEIPIESDEGVKFIGVFSGVNDSADHMPLTEGTIQEIIRFLRGSYTTEIRKFKMFGGRLHHTRDEAYFEGCVFSRNAALNRFGTSSTSPSPLPDSLESIWVARGIEFLAMEGWLVQEGQYYGNFAQSGIARLKARDLEIPTLPTNDASANAVTN